MEEESFIGAFGDVPTDLAGDYSQLFIFRTEDFGEWCRRVRNAHLRDTKDRELSEEHGLVRLPVDADGEYIHIGDVMEWPYGNGEFIVEGIGGNTLFYIDKDSNECEWTAAGDKRHHHEPTVEDVLREFTDEVWNRCCEGATASDSGIDELVSEFAAKLQVREENS